MAFFNSIVMARLVLKGAEILARMGGKGQESLVIGGFHRPFVSFYFMFRGIGGARERVFWGNDVVAIYWFTVTFSFPL